MMNLGWIVRLVIRGGTTCSEFITSVNLQLRGKATRLNVTFQHLSCDLLKKKLLYLSANKISVILISTVNRIRCRQNSTHCLKRSAHFWFQRNSACFQGVFCVTAEFPATNVIPPIIQPYHSQQFLSSMLQKSKCLN